MASKNPLTFINRDDVMFGERQTSENVFRYLTALPGVVRWSKRNYKGLAIIFAFIILCNFAIKGAFGFEPAAILYAYTIGKTLPSCDRKTPEGTTEADWLKGKYIVEWRPDEKNPVQQSIIEITKVTPMDGKPHTFLVEAIGTNNSVRNYHLFGHYRKGNLYLSYSRRRSVNKGAADGLEQTCAGSIYLEANQNTNELTGYWHGVHQSTEGAKKAQSWTVKLIKQYSEDRES